MHLVKVSIEARQCFSVINTPENQMHNPFESILPKSSEYDEEEIISAITIRVSEMLDNQPELLMSYLYRLDVLEKDLKRVLAFSHKGDIIHDLADLIWKRQKLRMHYKNTYKQNPIEGWEF